MTSTKPTTAMLHYSAPPVVGGVEAVLDAHARLFLQMGYPVSLIAGQGSADALPPGSELLLIPELDSQHRDILAAGAILEQGRVPKDFAALTQQLTEALAALANLARNTTLQVRRWGGQTQMVVEVAEVVGLVGLDRRHNQLTILPP